MTTISRSVSDLTASQLTRKLEICDELIDVLSILEPGISNSSLNVKFEKSAAHIGQIKNDYKLGIVNHDKAVKLIDSEMTKAKSVFEILLVGGENKKLLEHRLNQLTNLN